MELRLYQKRILGKLWNALLVKNNVLCVAPCSAGKTVLFTELINKLQKRVIILLDREVLVRQTMGKFKDCGVVCSSVAKKKEYNGLITVASRQTLINHLNGLEPVSLLVIDEAHLMGVHPCEDQYAKIIDHLQTINPTLRILGFTASPYRLGCGYIYGDKNKKGSIPYFSEIDAQVTTRELLDGGYIAPLTGKILVSDTLLDDLSSVGKVAGEYNIGQLSSVMIKGVHLQSCLDAYLKFASDRKKTIIFCTTIEHCTAVADLFNESGITCEAIHSKLTKLENYARMESLRTGKSRVYTSVAKLTVGMDVIDIDCIMMARKTMSTALYQQIIGRGQRLAPGKENCLVIDLVGNTSMFGTDFDNLRVNIPSDKKGDAPFKLCPNIIDGFECMEQLHASVRICPKCGYQFTKESIEALLPELKTVEFNEKPEPKWLTVTQMTVTQHTSKKNGKKLLKIALDLDVLTRVSRAYVWICFSDFYEGYAVERGEETWLKLSFDPFPEDVITGAWLAEDFKQPKRIYASIEANGFYKVEEIDGLSDEVDSIAHDYTEWLKDNKDEGTGDTVPF